MKIISVCLFCLTFSNFSNAMSNNESALSTPKKLSCENIVSPESPQIFKFGLLIYSSDSKVDKGYLTYTENLVEEYTM
ncbi:hypothetical protein [Fluviispira vulneris]|uniref:hypothetical protein n=1 Tax=Fluviispira vulneris TaxID=2763012 RepID=UPI001646531E|nr:hypothetical protein [Fluviispira vulneris]